MFAQVLVLATTTISTGPDRTNSCKAMTTIELATCIYFIAQNLDGKKSGFGILIVFGHRNVVFVWFKICTKDSSITRLLIILKTGIFILDFSFSSNLYISVELLNVCKILSCHKGSFINDVTQLRGGGVTFVTLFRKV